MVKPKKNKWTDFPTGIEEEITKLAEELGMSFAEFTRNATYSIYFLIKQHGIKNMIFLPTYESGIKRMIIKEDDKHLERR